MLKFTQDPGNIKDEYLGDGVYASYDGYHIWLDLRAQDSTTKIALEGIVINNLLDYIKLVTRENPKECDSNTSTKESIMD